MHKDRIELLADDLWHHVFEVLDNEPELDTELSSAIARRIQTLFTELCGDGDRALTDKVFHV